MFFVVSSDDTPVCPVCGGTLKYRDTRLSIRNPDGPYISYHGDSKLSSLKTTHESSLVTAHEISNSMFYHRYVVREKFMSNDMRYSGHHYDLSAIM